MKTTISLLFILILSLAALGQLPPPAEYIFADKDSEFSVAFPTQPKIEVTFHKEFFAVEAKLIVSNVFLRAENTRLKAGEVEKITQKDDKAFGELPMKYAAASELTNSTVTVERDQIGRFAKLRGHKTIAGTPCTYEIYFYAGKNEIITLYAGTKSDSYPTSEIKRFLDSLRLNPNTGKTTDISDRDPSGNLTGRAKSLPAPGYPSEARSARARGGVAVQVRIDEEGNVVSAQALSGAPLLHQAASAAAMKSKFHPFYWNRQKLKVTGVIVYNFIP
jgi:TonB family protein